MGVYGTGIKRTEIGSSSVTSSSAVIISASETTDSKLLILTNTGSTTCYLNFGAAAVSGQGVVLAPNGTYVSDYPNTIHAIGVSAVTESGTTSIAYMIGFGRIVE